jgi:hypothetical protein
MVDEICGGTDHENYLDAFRVPMFRDGAQIGHHLFVVDGTHLWVLDVSDPTRPRRVAVASGFGEPLSTAAHPGGLVIAAGAEGLVGADVSNAAEPARTFSVALPGPALRVHVSGTSAFVAMGRAGVGVVDLAVSPPRLASVLTLAALPGAFAAGAVERDGRAYVAACNAFAVLDARTGALVGQTWRPDATKDGILVAPAKDVALVGDVAFVAAGRFGAVAVDVGDPARPSMIGNCTVRDDLSFYASGVRASGDQLFVAGGEWGVLPVRTTTPRAACPTEVVPKLPQLLPESGASCSAQAPWEVLPWEQLWAPPPPRRDPVQVLPSDGRVFAFGDARRIGLRAVDVHATSEATLPLVGRYDEPRLVVGLSAAAGKLLALGPGGGLFVRDDKSLLVPASGELPPLEQAVAGAVLADGRWAIATPSAIRVQGQQAAPLALPQEAQSVGMAARGTELLVAARDGVVVVDTAHGTSTKLAAGREAKLPAALAADGPATYLAAPEWVATRQLSGGAAKDLAAHGVFDSKQILDVSLWRTALPRRLLVTTQRGLVEVASLGGKAGLVLHGASLRSLSLPSGTYVGAAAAGDRVFVAAADRATYRSYLLTVELAGGWPKLASIEAFTGVATSAAADADRLYVGDADRGVRVYAVGPNGASLLGVVETEVKP